MKRFKHILRVADPGQPTDRVLERAVALACNQQPRLAVVTDAPDVVTTPVGPGG
jgi:hypothetical protein